MEDDVANPKKGKKTFTKPKVKRDNPHEEVEVELSEAKDKLKRWLS